MLLALTAISISAYSLFFKDGKQDKLSQSTNESFFQATVTGGKGIVSEQRDNTGSLVINIDAPECSKDQKLIWTKQNGFECIAENATSDTETTIYIDRTITKVVNNPGVVTDPDPDTNNYVSGITFDTLSGELSMSREGLSGLSVDLDGRYLTSYTETDGIIGNEVAGAAAAGGLVLSGTGTTLSPYLLGVNYSGNCSGASQKLLYDGTSGAWSCATDIDTDTDTDTNTTYNASENGLTLSGTTFGLELDGTTLSTGANGLKVSQISSAEITNSTISNDDVSSAAALDWSKISKTGAKITDLDVPSIAGNANNYLTVNSTGDALVWVSGTPSGVIADDSLDFDKFADTMSLDAGTTFTFGTYDMIFNLTSTGDFRIQDNGIDVLYVSDLGKVGINTSTPVGNLDVIGNAYVRGDRYVDCNGTTSDEAGSCIEENEGAIMTAVEGADRLCTDSLSVPSVVRIDTDSDCTNGTQNEGSYILGKNSVNAGTSAISWAFFDKNSDSAYTDGEDLYIDIAPLLTYQSGTLYANRIKLTDQIWDDLRISGSSMGTGNSSPDKITWVNGSNLTVYGFDGTNTLEQLYFEVQVPHNYKQGTTLHPHLHWSPSTTGSGNVKWKLEYSWVNINSTAPAVSTITTIQAAGGTAYKHNLVEFPDIPGTNMTLSSMIVGRLYRDPTDSEDTYTGDAGFLEFDLHYMIDGFGSEYELSKN